MYWTMSVFIYPDAEAPIGLTPVTHTTFFVFLDGITACRVRVFLNMVPKAATVGSTLKYRLSRPVVEAPSNRFMISSSLGVCVLAFADQMTQSRHLGMDMSLRKQACVTVGYHRTTSPFFIW